MSDAYRSMGFQPLADEFSPWWEQLAAALVRAQQPPRELRSGMSTNATVAAIMTRLKPRCCVCNKPIEFCVWDDPSMPATNVTAECHGVLEKRTITRRDAVLAGLGKMQLIDLLAAPWFNVQEYDPHWKGWQP